VVTGARPRVGETGVKVTGLGCKLDDLENINALDIEEMDKRN